MLPLWISHFDPMPTFGRRGSRAQRPTRGILREDLSEMTCRSRLAVSLYFYRSEWNEHLAVASPLETLPLRGAVDKGETGLTGEVFRRHTVQVTTM